VEGQNVAIEPHFAEGKPEQLRALATERVRLGPDVILASGERTTPAFLATTSAVPIVQPTLTDPVERGYAKSLARPGGNLTGLSLHVDQAIYGKLIEILKEAAPRIARVAVLHRVSRAAGATSPLLETITPAAERLGITLVSAVVEREDQLVEAVTLDGRVGVADARAGRAFASAGPTIPRLHRVLSARRWIRVAAGARRGLPVPSLRRADRATAGRRPRIASGR
jgi:ABC-type uncharacterized transport system substrate-binding protein